MNDTPEPNHPMRPQTDTEISRWFVAEVLPHESALRNWLALRFGSILDVDDIVQEAFTRLLRTVATGPVACARGYLFVTARNIALNYLRHKRYESAARPEEAEMLDLVDQGVSVPDAVTVAEELRLLIAAIDSLPDRCREILTLRKIYGLSQKEVAARLGITEHTVESQGGIGMQKCIEYFRRHGYRGELRR